MKLSFFTIACLIRLNTYSQAPTIQWQTGLSGSQTEHASFIKQTSDGGYITTGDSYSNDGNFTGNHGNGDGWISKLDANGAVQWTDTYGGSSLDNLLSIIETSDGGYIAVGRVYSNDGDVSGFHTNPSDPNTTDSWVVKLDNTGVIQWQRALGGRGSEEGRCILETTNGYMVVSLSSSNDGDLSFNHGTGNTMDYWVTNIDLSGNVIWEETYGGTGDDMPFTICKTTDGGFAISGMSNSSDGDVSIHHGFSFIFNCWTIKIGSTGTLKWNSSFLLSGHASAASIKETSDKGFIISGRTGMAGSMSTFDGLLLKTDSLGVTQWQKTFGGSQRDEFSSVTQLPSGDYTIAGFTASNDGDVSNFLGGGFDCWLLNTDSNGNLLLEKTYGGSGDDVMACMDETTDGSFVTCGYSSSTDVDVTTNTATTNANVWIVKFNPLSTALSETKLSNNYSIFPNPATDKIHINISGHFQNEHFVITNTLGQVVLTGNLENQLNTLDIDNLTAGFYSLQIGEQKQSYKLIKN